jgi:hypothetical protein
LVFADFTNVPNLDYRSQLSFGKETYKVSFYQHLSELMSKKLFHGSCHCGKIKFQANIDLSKESGKCNCTFCRKTSFWSSKVGIEDFKLSEGEENKKIYTNSPEYGYYVFCDHCGTRLYGYSPKTEWSEEGYSIRIQTLDDISIEEMNSMPIKYYNGIDDTWGPITDLEEIKALY